MVLDLQQFLTHAAILTSQVRQLGVSGRAAGSVIVHAKLSQDTLTLEDSF
jgi:hypothetical protein